MNNHVDILTLLDYARGEITSDEVNDQISDHLGECNQCLQILKSHDYLVRRHDFVLERLFSADNPIPFAAAFIGKKKEAVNLSMAGQVNAVILGIRELINKASFRGDEIREKIFRILDGIMLLPELQEKLLLVPASNDFLGIDFPVTGDGDGTFENEQRLHLAGGHVRMNFLDSGIWKLEDFIFEFAGNCFYIHYEKEDFDRLESKGIALVLDEFPFILHSVFEKTGDLVSAKFNIQITQIDSITAGIGENEAPGLTVYMFIIE